VSILNIKKTRAGRVWQGTLVAFVICSLLFSGLLIPATIHNIQAQALPPYTVTGNVYNDRNSDGQKLPLVPGGREEPGVANVTVRALDYAGNPVGTATTNALGDYTLNVASGVPVRIEFLESSFPVGFRSSWFRNGGTSTTSVTFVSANSTVSLGIVKAKEYCQDNPAVCTTRFVVGDQATVSAATLLDFPYNAGSDVYGPQPNNDYSRFDQPTTRNLNVAGNQIGATWGIAWDNINERSGTLYTAAYMKRHSGFAPPARSGGNPTGAIYRVISPTTSTLYFNLNNLAGVSTGPDAHHQPPYTTTSWLYDYRTFTDPAGFTNTVDAVGKVALGDLDISEDGSTMYTINLYDRRLYSLPVTTALPLNPALVRGFDIPRQGLGCNPNDVRPFALGINNERVYVGAVCSAQTSQLTTDLRLYVFEFNPVSGTFAGAPVLNAPINFPRRCADGPGCNPTQQLTAEWRPWSSDFFANTRISNFPIPPGLGATGAVVASNPQPIVTNIAFDDGDMIMSFRDRFGDQVGFNAFSNPVSPTVLYRGIGVGDILRACQTGATWTLENNGVCGSRTNPDGQNRQEGPGGGEFYGQDQFPYFKLDGTREDIDASTVISDYVHNDIGMGGITYIPGFQEVIETVFDPISYNSPDTILQGGFRWHNVDGRADPYPRAYRLYNSPDGAPPTYGKASGLGDLEALCNSAPLEIGNRVWYDGNRNGVQDATNGSRGQLTDATLTTIEFPVPGVTVRLYDGNTVIATTTTGPAGEYIFNDNSVPGGLRRNYNGYRVRLDNPADYAAGGPLFGPYPWQLTTAQAGPNRFIDNNGVPVASFPEAAVVTGKSGQNDHTYDFGFFQQPPPTPTPTPTNTPIPTPTPTATPTSPGGNPTPTPPPGGNPTPTPVLTPTTPVETPVLTPTTPAGTTPPATTLPPTPTVPPGVTTPVAGTTTPAPGTTTPAGTPTRAPGLPNTGQPPPSDPLGWLLLQWTIAATLLAGGATLVYRGIRQRRN
jgi:SdrD B-like domain